MTETKNVEDNGRRREPRVTINKEFESVEKFINEYVSNISRTGAFIRSKQPLPVGTKVQLRFTVIMQELETIEGVGEVVRVEEGDEERGVPSGMGVVFTKLDKISQKLIEQLVSRPRTDGLADEDDERPTLRQEQPDLDDELIELKNDESLEEEIFQHKLSSKIQDTPSPSTKVRQKKEAGESVR